MSFIVDPKDVEKLKNIMKEKITGNVHIPDDTKFRSLLNFDLNKKVKISDKQILVAERLQKAYYKDNPAELQKDLDSIDRKLPWANFSHTVFSNLDLSGVEFSISEFEGAEFKNTNLMNAKLIFVLVNRCDFSGARMDGANMSMCKSASSKFIGTSMVSIDLTMSDISGSNFNMAQLPMANISSSDARNCNFMSSNLSGADLSNCALDNADFSSADLSGVNIEGSSIAGTIFESMRNSLEKKGVNYGDGEVKLGFREPEDSRGYQGGSSAPYKSNTSSYIKKHKYMGGDI